jgi:hypothetical protein
MNAVDSMLAGGTASITAHVAAIHDTPEISPYITQILVPLIAAVLVPYLKDLAAIHIKSLKDRLAKRKRGKKNDKNDPDPPQTSLSLAA